MLLTEWPDGARRNMPPVGSELATGMKQRSKTERHKDERPADTYRTRPTVSRAAVSDTGGSARAGFGNVAEI